MLGFYFAVHTVQFNNFSHLLFTRHDRKWACIFMVCCRINLGFDFTIRKKMWVLRRHLLRTAGLNGHRAKNENTV